MESPMDRLMESFRTHSDASEAGLEALVGLIAIVAHRQGLGPDDGLLRELEESGPGFDPEASQARQEGFEQVIKLFRSNLAKM